MATERLPHEGSEDVATLLPCRRPQSRGADVVPHRSVSQAPLRGVWTQHRAVKQGQSGGSVGTTSQGNGSVCRAVRIGQAGRWRAQGGESLPTRGGAGGGGVTARSAPNASVRPQRLTNRFVTARPSLRFPPLVQPPVIALATTSQTPLQPPSPASPMQCPSSIAQGPALACNAMPHAPLVRVLANSPTGRDAVHAAEDRRRSRTQDEQVRPNDGRLPGDSRGF